MVAVTNELPAASKNSLLVIHAFCGSDTTSRLYIHKYAVITSNKIPSKAIEDVFISRIRQWMTFSLPEIISLSPCTTAQKWTFTSRDIWCTVKSLGLVRRQKRKRRFLILPRFLPLVILQDITRCGHAIKSRFGGEK